MLKFREEFKALFHLSDAESISLAESNTISAITASTPYSGRPIGVVNKIALVAATVVALVAATVVALVAAIVVALVAATVVALVAATVVALVAAALDTTIVSIFLYKLL